MISVVKVELTQTKSGIGVLLRSEHGVILHTICLDQVTYNSYSDI